MKSILFLLAVILLVSFAGCHTTQRASRGGSSLMAAVPPPSAEDIRPSAAREPVRDGGVTAIIKPAQSERPESAPISSPVEVCMRIRGYTVEAAKNGDNEGKGHHHIMIDVPLPRPENMNRRLAKDQNNIHLGNGADCKTINLSPGIHILRTIFAYGSHIPYNPPITDSVIIFVK